MEAKITSIKLKKLDNNHSYWVITLIDKHDKILEVLDIPRLSDSVNFRKQTFGILSAINCFDLLRLFTENPNNLRIYISEDFSKKIEYVKNLKGDIFRFDGDNYVFDKSKKIFRFVKKNSDEIEAEIESITSASGVFNLRINAGVFTTFYSTGQIYYGFGYPFLGTGQSNQDFIIEASQMYKSFIECILKLYNVDDLLKINRTDNILYPTVEVEFDDFGHAVSIGNIETGMYLEEKEDSYEIVKKNLEVKQDAKKKIL